MAARIQSMTGGKPGKLIFSFALPLMVGNVFQQLYTVVDTMVVGKYLGVDALAALGASDWLNWMMLGIALGTSAVIAAVMLVFGRAILGWFISGTPQEVEQTLSIAYFYLAVMSVCLPVLYILHVVRSAIQGMGNTALPMVSGVVEFLMRTAAALCLPLAVGETGIFFAEPAAWLGADVVLAASYLAVAGRTLRGDDAGDVEALENG